MKAAGLLWWEFCRNSTCPNEALLALSMFLSSSVLAWQQYETPEPQHEVRSLPQLYRASALWDFSTELSYSSSQWHSFTSRSDQAIYFCLCVLCQSITTSILCHSVAQCWLMYIQGFHLDPVWLSGTPSSLSVTFSADDEKCLQYTALWNFCFWLVSFEIPAYIIARFIKMNKICVVQQLIWCKNANGTGLKS